MFKCRRCGYETEYKCALVSHLQRKTICDVLFEDIELNILITELKKKQLTEGFNCNFCDKIFSNSQGKYQHKKTCKKRPDNIDINTLSEEVAKLKKIVSEQQKFINAGGAGPSSINNNNIQNNNITINLNNFGNERIQHIDNEFIKECLKEMNMIKLLEHIHFDPNHPENHTVRIKNINKNLLEYHQEGRWIIEKKDKVLEDMINCSGYKVLKTFYRNNEKEVNDEIKEEEGNYVYAQNIIEEMNKWLEKINEEDDKIFKNLKENIFLIILNNKALICGR